MSKTDTNITNWASNDGHFRRAAAAFRNTISKDSTAEFPAEKDRYVLYVSYACPWAHRALIVRQLKGLDKIIGLSIVHPHMDKDGWSFNGVHYEGQGSENGHIPGVIPDPLYKFDLLRQLYFKSQSDYDGRYTVPVLFDSKSEKIVNNESSEIIRMFNTQFDDLLPKEHQGVTYYPDNLIKEIEELNTWVYDTVNNGVYKSGFATSEGAYLENVKKLKSSMDKIEQILDGKDYLIGDQLTEADIRLYTTMCRFDPVYVGHFKCNFGTVRANYPNIHKWMKKLYWKNPAFKDTTNFTHIKVHYYTSHPQINPTRIVPYGPIPNIESL